MRQLTLVHCFVRVMFVCLQAEFTKGYLELVRGVLASYGTTKPLPAVVHICNTSNAGKHCDYIQRAVRSLGAGNVYSDTGDKGEPPKGCNGHRDATQQKALGSRVASVIKGLQQSHFVIASAPIAAPVQSWFP